MPDLQSIAAEALHTTVKSVNSKQIARLWAGYGTITSLQATTSSSSTPTHLIIKQVDPPRGAGVSHNRKLQSYAVEASFYSHCADVILNSGLPCHLPRPMYLECQPPAHFLFALSDLRQQYPEQRHSYDLQETQVALSWLAAFHALWWEEGPTTSPSTHKDTTTSSSSSSSSSSSGPSPASAALAAAQLWPQGCYWHLDTRQEELQQMGSRWRPLQQAAPLIDQALEGVTSAGVVDPQHRTLVHGDFKSENVLFSRDGSSCAAYDYQYVGGGYGMKDVVYMLCSSTDVDVCEGHEQQLLEFYRQQLLSQLAVLGKHSAAARYSSEVMQRHYKLALMDYVRFMAGWGMWGNSSWAESRCLQWLPQLQDLLQ